MSAFDTRNWYDRLFLVAYGFFLFVGLILGPLLIVLILANMIAGLFT